MLEIVAQGHEGDRLPGEVAMLAPARDLVVTELGLGVPERRDLCVLVHLRLPPLGSHRAEHPAPVDKWDRSPDVASQVGDNVVSTCRRVVAGELVAAADETAHGLVDPARGPGTSGAATAATLSPGMPVPPMPSTTTALTSSISGSPARPFDRSAAAGTCSGRARVASRVPWESVACVPSIVTRAKTRRTWA